MFAYLLNTASSLLAASGPAAKRVEAIRHKLEVGVVWCLCDVSGWDPTPDKG